MDSGVIQAEVIRHPDRLESSSSSINVPWHHLPGGNVFRLSCAAQIADLVTAVSDEMLVTRPDPEKVLELKKNCAKISTWCSSFFTILYIFVVKSIL